MFENTVEWQIFERNRGEVARGWKKLTCGTMNAFRHFGRTPWTGYQPIAIPLPTEVNTTQGTEDIPTYIHTYIHTSLEQDSNPRSQYPSGPRPFAPSTARPPGPARVLLM